MWYRLSEELLRINDNQLSELFKPYVQRLLSHLCVHCQLDEDTSPVSVQTEGSREGGRDRWREGEGGWVGGWVDGKGEGGKEGAKEGGTEEGREGQIDGQMNRQREEGKEGGTEGERGRVGWRERGGGRWGGGEQGRRGRMRRWRVYIRVPQHDCHMSIT